MPIAEKYGNVYAFPMSKDGVNLHKNILELNPTECFQAQNCRWVNGMVKRGGQGLLTSTEVVASKAILGLHKLYKSDGSSQLLAAAGTLVKYFTSPSTWTSIGLTQTTGLQTYMTTWGALNKAYICNGTDKMAFWNGRVFSATCTITIASPGVITSNGHGFVAGDAVQFTTTGALPTGITAGTTYYVIAAGLTANAFEISTTRFGSVVNTSGSQSGVHTVANVAGQITIADGIPSFALTYQDRLLTIIGGNLTWSASFSDTDANWGTTASIGVKPDTILYGMCYHSVTSSSAGAETKVLLAGANGMYLFAATDLRWPSTTGDYTIYQLAIPVGCNAPRTMVWTPYGTIWLGIDRQVYMLPFGSVTPVPIGNKITSVLSSGLLNLSGIETIPTTQIANAAAVYNNGYYILSVAGAGASNNTVQWWLDVKRLAQDDTQFWGPWYGPMTGQSISCFFSQTGNGDGGELMAGEATAKGYVYQVAQDGVYGDITPSTAAAAPIPVIWQTAYNPLGNPTLRCTIHKLEAELLGTSGQINVDFSDIDQTLKTGNSFDLGGTQVYWNDYYWNEQYWSNSSPVRQVIDISPAILPRRLSFIFRQNVSNDKFELYSVTVEALEDSQVFA